MIVQHTADNQLVLFVPEDLAERKKLDAFPGLIRQGLQFYCPNKQHLVYNLYTRLCRKIKNIKYTPAVRQMIEEGITIRELPSWFKFHTQPLKHQLIALRFAYTFGSFLNLSEPGLGKTKVTLDYIWLLRAVKSLIVCPKALRFVWETEALKHRPELSVYVVETTDWEKELPHVMAADVVVINYDKAVSLLEPLKRLQIDFMAVDEGLIKNPSTERTKALTALSKGVKYRCVMSGTLVNNSPLDVFAPLRFIEPSLVGESFTKFRDEYAVMVALGKGGYGPRIVTGFKHKDEVKEILGCCGVIMTKKEWLTTLPPKKFIHKYVTMGDKQREYYQDLGSNYILQLPELDTEIEVDNPLSVLIKLNQISNGFIYYKENTEETLNDLYGTESRKGSKGVRKTYFFEEQPKIEALIRLVQSEEFNGSVCASSYNATESSGLSTGRRLHSESSTGDRSKCDSGCRGNAAGDRSTGSDASKTEYAQISIRSEQPDFADGCHDTADKASGVHSDTNGCRAKNCSLCSTCKQSSNDGVSGNCCAVCSGSASASSELSHTARDGKNETSQTGSQRHKRSIIWFNLDAERVLLQDALTKAGISFLTIAGGTKRIGDIVRQFNEDPSIRFLLCQAKTINYGVTIMGTKEEDLADEIIPDFDPQVSDEIFYSLNFSLEVFLQQQDRIHRIGQTRECRYWILLTNSKIERRIADRLEEKLICNKEILVDIMGTLDKDMLES